MVQAMQGSASEHSYAQNSGTQNHGFHCVAKPRLSEAIRRLSCNRTGERGGPPCHIAIADLGCAYGRNTLDCAEFVVRALCQASAEKDASSSHNIMEIQYFFSDLPSNDFNALFQSLQPYLHQSDSDIADPLPKFFAAGVPGSFYGRLFPTASLDLVVGFYCLHWLSQVPPSLLDQTSPAWNGGHTWISKVQPSKAVEDAYARQYEIDVIRFLKSRADELTSGGILFLLWPARSSSTLEGESVYDHLSNDITPIEFALDFLDYAWKEMVDEGLIAPEMMDTFNFRFYFFNQQELESAVKDVPELRVLHIDTIKDVAIFPEAIDPKQVVEQWVRFLSSIIKTDVEAHVGKVKADEMFKKLKTICLNQHCFNARLTYSLVVASLQRM